MNLYYICRNIKTMIKSITTIYYNEVELDVEYYFTPGFGDEPRTFHDFGGVFVENTNIRPLLTDEQEDQINQILIDKLCNDY